MPFDRLSSIPLNIVPDLVLGTTLINDHGIDAMTLQQRALTLVTQLIYRRSMISFVCDGDDAITTGLRIDHHAEFVSTFEFNSYLKNFFERVPT